MALKLISTCKAAFNNALGFGLRKDVGLFNSKTLLQNWSLGNSNQIKRGLKYVDHRMDRDVYTRTVIKKYGFERLNRVMLNKNKILPIELREISKEETHAMPITSCYIRCHERCMVTSRGRGLVKRYRVSRMIWREQADYNKLHAVQRALWHCGHHKTRWETTDVISWHEVRPSKSKL